MHCNCWACFWQQNVTAIRYEVLLWRRWQRWMSLLCCLSACSTLVSCKCCSTLLQRLMTSSSSTLGAGITPTATACRTARTDSHCISLAACTRYKREQLLCRSLPLVQLRLQAVQCAAACCGTDTTTETVTRRFLPGVLS